MTPVRCPKCNRLLGYFVGKGEIVCTRCRKDAKVYFDTDLKITEIKTKEESG
jgi:phage FluMu protein Com